MELSLGSEFFCPKAKLSELSDKKVINVGNAIKLRDIKWSDECDKCE